MEPHSRTARPTCVNLKGSNYSQIWKSARKLRREQRLAWTCLASAAAIATAVWGGVFLDGPQDLTQSPGARTDHVLTSGPTNSIATSHSIASCVETCSATTVAQRAFAFDGTVTAIGRGTTDRPDRGHLNYAGVTFTVNEWFVGGSSRTVTIDLPPLGLGIEDDSTGWTYSIGTRLLVSGEPRWGGPALRDAIGWGCGFTRAYNASTASAWRTATDGQ
jgi:hypothetical protein